MFCSMQGFIRTPPNEWVDIDVRTRLSIIQSEDDSQTPLTLVALLSCGLRTLCSRREDMSSSTMRLRSTPASCAVYVAVRR